MIIVIRDQKVEFHKADHLMVKTVSEKSAAIREELGDKRFCVLCIGPAGERLVKIASVMADDRAAGRCGVGAVEARRAHNPKVPSSNLGPAT